ncbi:MAG: hypothetical protein IPI12_04650 [Ignavibacteriales bacterium]|jgi:ABC-type transport system involved in multi-copper enzyme maturation permease subunit|nr:hypothetical protein [Ignavibacteriales bacterium]MBP7543314.1 hypothetical protein [Ignavibacteriaceae bacterium]MBK7265621.1 hypothetical protein [Ignavibacteriales bacterium]MBK8661505.1 hypothetical protein [Ignavibacteriales bacterium]MBP9122951.1 hypothetical protein [Ignavibacteriaceae bacterium]
MKGITQSVLFFFDHLRRSKSFWVTIGGVVVMIVISALISYSVYDNITPGTAVAKIQQSYDFTLINLLNATTQLMIFVGLFTVAITVNSVIKRGVFDIFLSFPVRRWELLTGAFLSGIIFMFVVLLFLTMGIWVIHSSIFGMFYGEVLHWGLLNLLGFVIMFHLVIFVSFGFRSPIAGLLTAIAYSVIVSSVVFVMQQMIQTSSKVWLRETVNVVYWILPKSSEFSSSFFMAGQPTAEGHVLKLIISSLLFIFTVFGLTIIIFEKKDY